MTRNANLLSNIGATLYMTVTVAITLRDVSKIHKEAEKCRTVAISDHLQAKYCIKINLCRVCALTLLGAYNAPPGPLTGREDSLPLPRTPRRSRPFGPRDAAAADRLYTQILDQPMKAVTTTFDCKAAPMLPDEEKLLR